MLPPALSQVEGSSRLLKLLRRRISHAVAGRGISTAAAAASDKKLRSVAVPMISEECMLLVSDQ